MQSLEPGQEKRRRRGSDHSESYIQGNGPEDHSADQVHREVSSKKRQRQWAQKQSKMSKIVLNNRRQQKLADNADGYEGIFLYKPGVQLPSLFHFANQLIKVIVASEYIKRDNPQYLKRNIFGSETYTSNSDCFCIGVHSGFINLNTFASKRYQGIQITFKVIKPKKNYNGATKNGMTSRTIKGYNGNALKPESSRFLTNLEPIQNLQRYASNMHIPIGKSRSRPKPKNIINVIPIPQTHLVFNMNNEPAYKYSIFNLADKGYQKNEFMVRKLDSHVLYLQTDKKQKYELSKIVMNHELEVYQFAKVLDPYCCDNLYFSSNYAPLNSSQIQVVVQGLDWEDISWGNTQIKIKQTVYPGITSFKYYKRNCK